MDQQNPGKAVHGGRIRHTQNETGKTLLDFSANLNPSPPQVLPDLSPGYLTCYPDDEYAEVKEAISRVFHRRPDEIAVGNGSIELIRVFCSAVLAPGDRVRIRHPTFGEYELSARLAGATLAGPGERASATFFCNPNNPTGSLIPREELMRETARSTAEETVMFVDEAFIELSDPAESLSDIRDPGLFVLRSLTKSFAVPGIRFGYAFGEPGLIARMETRRPPWSVNAFAEQYALAAFRQYPALEASRAFIRREREYLIGELLRFPLAIHPSLANFLLLTTGEDVAPLCDRLLSLGILVRDCHSFGLPRSIRIAVRTREENRQLLEALERCLP